MLGFRAMVNAYLLMPLLQSPLFRVGSGALVQRPSGPSTTSSFPPLAELGLPHPGGPYKPYPYKPLPLAEDNSLKPKGHDYLTKYIHLIVVIIPFLTIALLWYMMPGPAAGQPQLAGSSFNFRLPPQWSPDTESTYSFRAYMTDLSMWIMLTDLQPHQQCAAIIMRLGGAAREMGRMMTPQEMTMGGVINGIALDPVTYLLTGLQARFASMEEESRLKSMTEMLAFARKPGENINALLARYEVVRQRAAVEGQFVMSIEGCSLQLLRAWALVTSIS